MSEREREARVSFALALDLSLFQTSKIIANIILPPSLEPAQSPTHFSTHLTTLFESIALIISQHQPVVEKYYGPGKMIFVAGALLEECDRVGEKVLSEWEEERRIGRLVGEIAGTAGGAAGLAPQGARHKSQKSNVSNVGLGTGSPMLGRGVEGGAVEQGQEDSVDPREVDALLAELSMMSGRWQLLRRFLYGRLKVRRLISPSLARGVTVKLSLLLLSPLFAA